MVILIWIEQSKDLKNILHKKIVYEEFYNNGGIIIADRYVTSNMLHQGCKIKDIKKREEFLNFSS